MSKALDTWTNSTAHGPQSTGDSWEGTQAALGKAGWNYLPMTPNTSNSSCRPPQTLYAYSNSDPPPAYKNLK